MSLQLHTIWNWGKFCGLSFAIKWNTLNHEEIKIDAEAYTDAAVEAGSDDNNGVCYEEKNWNVLDTAQAHKTWKLKLIKFNWRFCCLLIVIGCDVGNWIQHINTKVYSKVSELAAWSEWYSSLPLGAILWISLVSFAAITLCVASQRVFIVVVVVVVYFVIDSVRILLDTPSCVA